VPSGFDLIPIGVTSKRLIVPAAEVNLQLSPYKRAKDREPSYYVAGKGRAVLPDPKSPVPGSFDDISRGPLSDNTTESVRTVPTSVFDVSNIRLVRFSWALRPQSRTQLTEGNDFCMAHLHRLASSICMHKPRPRAFLLSQMFLGPTTLHHRRHSYNRGSSSCTACSGSTGMGCHTGLFSSEVSSPFIETDASITIPLFLLHPPASSSQFCDPRHPPLSKLSSLRLTFSTRF
jgi:hypothetical protein